MMPCSMQFLMLSVLRSSDRASGDLHHGPEIGGDRGLGVLELPVAIEESVPECGYWRRSTRSTPAAIVVTKIHPMAIRR